MFLLENEDTSTTDIATAGMEDDDVFDIDVEDDDSLADAVNDVIDEAYLINSCINDPSGENLKFVQENFSAINEGRKMAKRTVVRMSKDDDLKRRKSVAAMLIAREKKDPDWVKAMKFRKLYILYKKKIIKKYDSKSNRAAKLSQRKHIKDMRKMPALPKITI